MTRLEVFDRRGSASPCVAGKDIVSGKDVGAGKEGKGATNGHDSVRA